MTRRMWAAAAAMVFLIALTQSASAQTTPAAPKPAIVKRVPPPPPGSNTCVECHSMQDDARLLNPTRTYSSDIHAQRGLSCASCHGGNPEDEDLSAMDPARGFVGKPARRDIAKMCVKCHGNAAYMKRFRPQPYVFSMDEFRSSFHSKHLEAGDDKAATCTNCHGVHGILAIKDPRSPVFPTNVPKTCAHCHNAQYMKGRSLPTDQYDKYVTSVHGRALLEKGDLSAPACNDCHGNHGAAPPNVSDIAFVCGTCHGREGELFEASKAAPQLILNGRRGCVTCHSNHDVQAPDDRLISVTPPGLCGNCHARGSVAEKQATLVTHRFKAIKDSLEIADSLLAIANVRGMEITDGQEALRDARDKMVEARVAVHGFNAKAMNAILDDANTNEERARTRGQESLRDWKNRRVGMAASLIAIIIVAGLLMLKIRSLEKPDA